MKSILLKGVGGSGKSTTVREVCKRLNPNKIWKLNYIDGNKSTIKESSVEDIFNGTFIIEVNGICILIVAGSPTEQEIQITTLVSICVELDINIEFAIVSMRSFERKDGFDTPKELNKLGEIILELPINKIDSEEYFNENIWNDRVSKITNSVLNTFNFEVQEELV